MKLLDVVHPAAKTLVDISLSQDAEVCVCPGGGGADQYRRKLLDACCWLMVLGGEKVDSLSARFASEILPQMMTVCCRSLIDSDVLFWGLIIYLGSESNCTLAT